MAAQDLAQNMTRLSDWIPLDMKGKPMFAGVNETERVHVVRNKINAVRMQWNDANDFPKIAQTVERALKSMPASRDLRSTLHSILDKERYWADQQRSSASPKNLDSKRVEHYGALEAYTTNEGYKHIFGHINQVFRKPRIDEIEIFGAVALVELLTIDLYNLRLANFGCSKYYNFQGIVHRGLSVDIGVLNTFRELMKEKIQNRNFSVPLAFISTSVNPERIQQFLDKTEKGKFRLHWKIHIHELEPKLLGQYRKKYPNSVVSTICAMPISQVSEYPDEQEILLRGPFFQILRMYEEKAGDGLVNVIEMVMLNANRDHDSELANHTGENKEQRTQFGQMCAATKYEICASLAKQYGLPDASEYRDLADEMLKKLRMDHIDAPFDPRISHSWSIPRPSWIGSSLRGSFPKYYTMRRDTFSKASYGGTAWDDVRTILDHEYDWEKADWCNVPRLHGTRNRLSRIKKCNQMTPMLPANNRKDTPEDAANASGFTVLHQAAFNNANPEFVQMLVEYGAWSTLLLMSHS